MKQGQRDREERSDTGAEIYGGRDRGRRGGEREGGDRGGVSEREG